MDGVEGSRGGRLLAGQGPRDTGSKAAGHTVAQGPRATTAHAQAPVPPLASLARSAPHSPAVREDTVPTWVSTANRS